jgi:dolichyl-phosphate-mannose-protein mannosyltransferase
MQTSSASLSHSHTHVHSHRRPNPLSTDSDDELADPRPWETRTPAQLYGSSVDHLRPIHPSLAVGIDIDSGSGRDRERDRELPMYTEMETRQRRREKAGETPVPMYGEKISSVPVVDDQGKWAKGHGPGPGVGGRRGLPPRQRIDGWVSGSDGTLSHFAAGHSTLVIELTSQRGLMVEHEEWIWTGVYTALSMITRYWQIGAANYVVWDEVR